MIDKEDIVRIKLEVFKELRSILNNAKLHRDKFDSLQDAFGTFLSLRIDRLEEEYEYSKRLFKKKESEVGA